MQYGLFEFERVGFFWDTLYIRTNIILQILYSSTQRRNGVAKAADEMWPGNDLPTFKKNDLHNLRELHDLVTKLEPKYSYTPAGFGYKGIRKHVMDHLNERRREVRKGHDFTQVCILWYKVQAI